MKKYRVTQRGKIVFGAIIIVFLLSFYYLVNLNGNQEQASLKDQGEVIEIDTASEEESLIENEENSQATSEEDSLSLIPDYSEEEMRILQEACFTVFYGANEYYVPEESLQELVGFLGIAKAYSNEHIIIEGNANLLGDKVYRDWEKGKNTGYDRALVIKNYLTDNGIVEDRITIINNGADKPVNIDLSKESLRLNRRVDVFFSNYYCEIKMDSK